MAVSDNAAADVLIDLLGAEAITARLHHAGATHTTVRAGVQAEVQAITTELDPWLSPPASTGGSICTLIAARRTG
jgi:beta-lactamase class A